MDNILKAFPAGHGETVYQHLKATVDRFLRLYESVWAHSEDEDLKRQVFVVGFYSAAMHDVGKAVDVFKKALCEKGASYYHSVLSAAVALVYFYPVIRYLRVVEELDSTSKGDAELGDFYNLSGTLPFFRTMKWFYHEEQDALNAVMAANYQMAAKEGIFSQKRWTHHYVSSYIPFIIYSIFHHHVPMGSWDISLDTERENVTGFKKVLQHLMNEGVTTGKNGKVHSEGFCMYAFARLVVNTSQFISEMMKVVKKQEKEWLVDVRLDRNVALRIIRELFYEDERGIIRLTDLGYNLLDGTIICNVQSGFGGANVRRYLGLRSGNYGALVFADWFASSAETIDIHADVGEVISEDVDKKIEVYLASKDAAQPEGSEEQ